MQEASDTLTKLHFFILCFAVFLNIAKISIGRSLNEDSSVIFRYSHFKFSQNV